MFFVCFHFELCTVTLYRHSFRLPGDALPISRAAWTSVTAWTRLSRRALSRAEVTRRRLRRAVSFQLTSSADPPSLSHGAPPMPPLPPPPPPHLSRDRTLALAFPVSSARDAAESGASDSQPTLDPETYNVFGDARKEEDDGVPNSTRKRHRLNDREKGQSVFDSLETIKQIRRHDRRAPRPS